METHKTIGTASGYLLTFVCPTCNVTTEDEASIRNQINDLLVDQDW